jgi:hypothetical protein
MKNFKLYVFSIFFTGFFLLNFSGAAISQGVDDFVISEFDAQYEITNDDPQGCTES